MSETPTESQSPAESGDFSQSIAIVYPASWPEREGAHVTISYLGEIPDVNFTKDDVQEVLSQFDYLNPDGMGMEFIAATDQLEMFGPDKNIPVMTLQSPIFDPIHQMITSMLRDKGIESASQFADYRPHITIKPTDIFEVPKAVFLKPPVLWWGANK